MKPKTIDLGYVAMYDYTSKTDLNPEWIREEGGKLVDANEVVLSKGNYVLVIHYPLTNAFKTKLVVKSGMTRRQLVAFIVKMYKKVYADEDKGVGHETGYISGMLNRAQSNGPYGIWGHVLSDLMLHTATVQKSGNITVGCDS
jgi:hypothetical protein